MNKGNIQKKASQIKIVYREDAASNERFDIESLIEELGIELQAMATSAGLLVINGIMGTEQDRLAGKRYDQTTEVDRWGKQQGYVMLGGQKVPVNRPRLRNKEGKEVVLESYQRFQQDDERTRAVFQRMVAGISCRSYPETIETVRDGYGISKSVVNREMVEATSEQLKLLMERDLSTFNLCVLIVDGVRLGESMFIVALGVDIVGKKQVMGFREGSTENAEVCINLFEDMVRRGIKTDTDILALLDGSKALHSAVKRFFGSNTPIQRCQFHKRGNVKKHLPQKYHAEFDRKIQAAYKMNRCDDAKGALQRVIKELTFLNHSAAESLAEGLEETLTVHRLELPELLRVSLSMTNLIESTFSRSRTVMRNVKRWQNSLQRQRWLATALLRSEKKFRKIRGYRALPMLINTLARLKKTNELDSEYKVA